MTLLVLSLALQIAPGPATPPASMPASDWEQMRHITPKTYACARASRPVTIDGKLDDQAWAAAPWTDDFIDIEGPRKPPPRFRTRAKMLWDDDYFYVAAELREPHVCATLTERNSVVYHDNDFEIFIDPDGDNHNYYEFEMNALGTIWELSLPKPYRDGGKPKLGTNIAGLKSAVHINGTINDPRDEDEAWTLEVAIPWKGLARHNEGRATPTGSGAIWRVNFSRVQWTYDVVDGRYVKRAKEKQPEDNWVWSPQGVIDMHRPERWGFVMFTDTKVERLPASIASELAVRDALMDIYYRQRAFKRDHKRWADSLAELGLDAKPVRLTRDGDGWTARTTVGGRTLVVHSDSRLGSE